MDFKEMGGGVGTFRRQYTDLTFRRFLVNVYCVLFSHCWKNLNVYNT